MTRRLGRKVIVTKDKPAFVGNRVGFKVLNEAAQLADEHGVAFIDYVVGPHTGRAMAPLATVDLVGWDVHKAIVDNVHANCPDDEAHECFGLPAYMAQGNRRRAAGRQDAREGRILSAGGGPDGRGARPENRRLRAVCSAAPIEFVERMKSLNRVGRYREAMEVLTQATGPEADLAPPRRARLRELRA